MMKKMVSVFLALVMTVLSLAGCKPTEDKKPTLQYKYFLKEYLGTVNSVYSYAEDEKTVFEANCAAVEELLDRANKLFDIYYEYSGINNIKTINKAAGKGEPVVVDSMIIDLLEYGKEVYALTEGQTNIAMGAVLSLWHDCRDAAEYDSRDAYLPDEWKLAEAARHVDINKLVIDRENSTVYLEDPLMSLDVGALAKGYVTDLARDLLFSRGATSYVLNFGGNVVEVGGDGWEIPLSNPNTESSEYLATLLLKNTAVITSGNYRRYFFYEGKRYHHLIDPDTLYPADYHSAVSVICESSAFGDALSTALFCMTESEGLSLIESLSDVEAMWFTKDGNKIVSSGWNNYVK